MKTAIDFGFYAILTSPRRGYTYCAQIAVDAGIRYLQLRIKDQPPSEVERIAVEIRKITEGSATKFIINDNPEIARACNADGLHIGQDDISFEDARSLLGDTAIIGISTHNPAQSTAACQLNPHYIGAGPVFPTPTKKNPDPVIGIDGLKKMLAVATVPVVAIGGIDCSNLSHVLEAGAKNFCMVREFTQAEDPQAALKQILQIYRGYYPTL